jgi:iron complex outermembrane recepter protein
MTHFPLSLRAALLLGTMLVAAPAWAATDAAGAAVDSAEGGDGAIVVTGQQQKNMASAGTKTALPIAETPQSISVISNADIAGLGLQNLNQALRFVAGVTPETRGSAAEVYDQFKLRGFDAPVFLDGLKMFASASGYATPQVDVSRLDRIEVLKGPSSALYGQSGPGGLVAEASKMPLDRAFYGAVSGTYGTYDLYRVDGDVGGRISDTALWRLYGSVNGAHQQQRFGRRERQTVSGAVTLGANQPTSFTVLAAYSHDPQNGTYGGPPALGTLIPNPAGKISTKLTTGEPNDRFSREQFGLTYIFRHDFGGGWAFRSSGRYQYLSSKLRLVYSSGSPVDATLVAPTVYNRASYATDETVNSWTYDNQLTGKVQTGPVQHNLMFGVDRQVGHSTELAAFGAATPLDFYNPIYGTMASPTSVYDVPDGAGGFVDPSYYKRRQRQQGIYAQDQISVGGLRLALSGRQDWARTADIVTGQVQHNQKFTYRVGALYVTPIGLAPYVSWSTSFEPQSGLVSNDGGLTSRNAGPTLGKQLEAGFKYTVPGTDILLTGAWFNIEQTNVLSAVPNTIYSTQSGKVRSRGIEVEATAPLPYGFNAKLAFSRQRVKVIADENPANVGKPLATVGRGGISANLEWAPKSGVAEGLTIGGAVRHVDRTYADAYAGSSQGLYTPSYTVFDALMRYDLGKLSPRLANVNLAVNATNLFDKKYLTSCYANYGWCWYGNRRTVQGTVSFSW